MTPEAITPFEIAVDEIALLDLRERLSRTRWPDEETVEDWSQGVPRAWLRSLCAYWEDGYDWRRVEARLNALPQFKTTIDGLGVHLLHLRSPHEGAVPLLLTHGWPGSVLEFLDVLGPLTDPVGHGGRAEDAFHVVVPALPGFGFSDKPAGTGWGVQRVADAWAELMARLGYPRYFAQGGDWGATVATTLGEAHPDAVAGIHLNYAALSPQALRDLGELSPEEHRALAAVDDHRRRGGGYSLQQSTRPQTLGYGLADSPVGQCAWIVEKFAAWSDCDGDPLNAFTRDALLDNVMLSWLPNAASSSARLYWESRDAVRAAMGPVSVPTAFSAFPAEIACFPERWVATRYRDLRYYHRAGRGGHFAAYEVPELFVAEVRAGIAALRGG